MKKLIVSVLITVFIAGVLLFQKQPEIVVPSPIANQVIPAVKRTSSAIRAPLSYADDTNTTTEVGPYKNFYHIPPRFSTHMNAKEFFTSYAKDSPIGQKIMADLIRSGNPVDYARIVYNHAFMLKTILEQPDPEGRIQDSYKRNLFLILSRLKEFGEDGLPPIKGMDSLDECLRSAPQKGYFPRNHPPLLPYMVTDPVDQWLTQEDIMKYITEHPAKAL